ncbi:hypothetical protein EZS27_036831 [termite gut metagenome]|uniref:SGNH hydrolase-type esterase domain-containing protein n=1 Tax=termite gut metagenome TaxID=433724 RepID=A0A5J4PTQ0_9ZZZZ
MLIPPTGLFSIINAKIRYFVSRKDNIASDYALSGFNEYGDYCKHWGLEGKKLSIPLKLKQFNHPFGEYFVKTIKELKNQCQVVIIPPVIRESAFRVHENNAEKINTFLLENDIPFLVPPQTHVVPDEYAYDTDYHVNRKGVDFYTTCIIKELKDVIK